MEILDLRHFSSVDLRPLLDDEARVWGSLLSWDYSGSAEMILRYVDAKILPGYAAIERGRIFGYTFFVYEGSKGVVGDLFVANGGRLPNSREVELKLLTHVIETLQQSPGVHRVEAQLLAHEAGSVARPFLEQGFQRHPRLFMVLGLGQSAPAAPATHPDVEIRRWTEADYQPAAAVITAAYRGHVDAQINDQYHTLAGSLRFLNNIVRFPGCGVFDAESSYAAVDRKAKNLIGLILCSRVRGDVGLQAAAGEEAAHLVPGHAHLVADRAGAAAVEGDDGGQGDGAGGGRGAYERRPDVVDKAEQGPGGQALTHQDVR